MKAQTCSPQLLIPLRLRLRAAPGPGGWWRSPALGARRGQEEGRLAGGARPLRRCSVPRLCHRGRSPRQLDPQQPRAWGAPPPPPLRGRARSGPALHGGAGPAGTMGLSPPPGGGPGIAKPRGFPRRRARAVPAICSGRAGCRGLRGSPPPRLALSTTSWSARQKRPSSRSANSSPGMSWRLQATQRKHSMWYTLARARITKSFLLKPMLHLAHLMPYNLSRAQPRKKEKGGKQGEHGRGKGEGREGAGGEGGRKEREKERGFHSRSWAAPGPA